MQLAVMLGYFIFEGDFLFDSFTLLIDTTLNTINQDLASATKQLSELFVGIFVRIMGSIAVIIIVMTLAAVVVQIGPLLAPEAIKPSSKGSAH